MSAIQAVLDEKRMGTQHRQFGRAFRLTLQVPQRCLVEHLRRRREHLAEILESWVFPTVHA